MLRKLAFFFIRFGGLAFLFRNFIQKRKVSILLFHDPTPKAFEKAVIYLKRHYKIITLERFLECLEKKQVPSLPNKSVVLTFDDGHYKNYLLFETLEKHQVPVTIFLCAGIVNTNRQFWFKTKMKYLNNQTLKKIDNNSRLGLLKIHGFDQKKEYDQPQALQKEQIEKMKSYVNFQSHTMFHPILPQCNNKEAEFEIETSFDKLKTDFNLNITTLAYPNGDYSLRDIEIAKNAGYKYGVTVDYGFNENSTQHFQIKRLSVNDTSNLNEFIAKSSGVWGFIKTRNGRRQAYGLQNSIHENSQIN